VLWCTAAADDGDAAEGLEMATTPAAAQNPAELMISKRLDLIEAPFLDVGDP
jgi:hypothetical protein